MLFEPCSESPEGFGVFNHVNLFFSFLCLHNEAVRKKNNSQSILGPLNLQLQKVCKMAGSHSNIYLYTTNPAIKSQGTDYKGFVMINKVISKIIWKYIPYSYDFWPQIREQMSGQRFHNIKNQFLTVGGGLGWTVK